MHATSSSFGQAYAPPARMLVVSGVTISKPAAADPTKPKADYEMLIDAFQPDILDMQNVRERMNPALRIIESRLGLQWVIAYLAWTQRHNYDVILATGEDIGLRLAFLLKYTGTRAPLILTCHNISTRRPSFFLRKLGVGSAVRTFQCLSQAQVGMLSERTQLRPNQTQMLYWHVDHAFFRPMPEVAVHNQICSAGMASRDYATLVAAAEGLDVDVKIAADSPWFQQELNIAQGSVSNRVEARSYGNYHALRQLYAESRFVVVPLFDVDFSAGYTVILEAMAMGKAVIVSRIRQRDDFIVDGVNGLYVTPGDVDDMRAKLRFLLENPAEAERIGANARKSVEERFTLNHYVQRMQQAVEGITSRR